MCYFCRIEYNADFYYFYKQKKNIIKFYRYMVINASFNKYLRYILNNNVFHIGIRGNLGLYKIHYGKDKSID